MTTYKTLAEARAAKADNVKSIAEIEHATDGRCFVGLTCNYEVFEHAIKKSPMADIPKLYGGHDALTDDEIKARDAKIEARVQDELKNNTRCDRCGEKVDGTTCYHQEERARLGKSMVRVRANYCDGCKRTLKAIGAGERSAMQERASHVPNYEPETYEDF